jgi:CheY-like chemotaxis protein
MTDELLSLRVMLVSASQVDEELFRKAASMSKVPIEIMVADNVASANRPITAGVGLVFIDMAMGSDSSAQLMAASRAAPEPPFTVLLSAPETSPPFPTDALATKPDGLEEAKRLIERAVRIRLPTRVMVVDDSATMRSIIHKILAATRFPLVVTEVAQAGEAIELVRRAEFEIVFVDYNMPGFSGLETIGELRREQPHLTFVLITASQDENVAKAARAQGVTFLKKPFFSVDIEAVLCSFYGLRALNPKRS